MSHKRHLKGFDHKGYAWSWPEFDADLTRTRPAHAFVAETQKAACGAEWPHVWTGMTSSTGYVPPREILDAMRNAAIRGTPMPHMCELCLAAVTPSVG